MDRVDYESLVIQDLENFYKRDELNLTPWYQRRSVWTSSQKGYLVNSIFEAKPIPTCYVRHYLDIDKEKSIKEVVDGQQRVRTILEFLQDEFSATHPAYDGKIRYSQLTKAEKADFRLSKISVGYLIGATDTDVIDIFGRLNSVSKTLNEQEKRNAKFSGQMKQFCLRIAAEKVEFWRESDLFSATDISRMSEVQFVSDLVLNLMDGLSDYSSARLNNLYDKFDDEFSKEKTIEKRLGRVFELLEEAGIDLIRNTIFSRPPLFFSLALLLDSQPKISAASLRKHLMDVDSRFQDVVEPQTQAQKRDQEFVAACTASTQRLKNREIRANYLKERIWR